MDDIRKDGTAPEENDVPVTNPDESPAPAGEPVSEPSETESVQADAFEEAQTVNSDETTSNSTENTEDNAPPSVPPQYQSERVGPRPYFGGDSRFNAPPPPPPHDEGPGAQRPPFTGQNFSHSGEYRYTPPYSDGAYSQSSTDTSPKKKEKKKKERTVRTFSTTALVLILVGAVLLSFAAGMGGALLVSGGGDIKKSEPEGGAQGSEGTVQDDAVQKQKDPLVIHKVEEDGADSSSGTLVGTYDISDVCSAVSPCVVEVTTEFNKIYYGQYHYVQEGAGSGVIISAEGYILTNAHVITDSETGRLADAITVRLNNSEEYTAEIIGSDSDSDVALIKIEAKDLRYATVGNSDKIEVGQQIIAVGNPLGELGGTVTSGIVSATNREITVENNKMTLIQIDAAINPGNSGGGLFNTNGELIGIVNAKTTDVTVEGLGFAIPVNEAIRVAEELQSNGYVTGKAYIGVSLVDVTSSFDAYYNFGSDSVGVYVAAIQEGYNDDVLKFGDRITAINDNEITAVADIKEILSESKVGDKLVFTVARGKKLVDVEVTCYEYVPESNVSFEEK